MKTGNDTGETTEAVSRGMRRCLLTTALLAMTLLPAATADSRTTANDANGALGLFSPDPQVRIGINFGFWGPPGHYPWHEPVYRPRYEPRYEPRHDAPVIILRGSRHDNQRDYRNDDRREYRDDDRRQYRDDDNRGKNKKNNHDNGNRGASRFAPGHQKNRTR
jgi:hypothetical protein